eukprot:CAMPEP_0194272446 /NCGR_PEP_ID=MMETSP0169-20130528/6021_1 /TAXON_ID=218684 /ORGANISM="Corethron pennatum, Strain L29A3" /LENGTH=109 /DNA_ID=CAMNT_0039015115 /DNA_START=255 /DNA_END=580 /DNA_ORIENTATION=+
MVAPKAKLLKSVNIHKSITTIAKENDNALSLKELKISEMKIKLNTCKKEFFQASSNNKSLKEKVAELENELVQNLVISNMHLKSKQEAENTLKKEKVKFEEELKKAQMT